MSAALAAFAQTTTINHSYNGWPRSIRFSADDFTVAEVLVSSALQIGKVTVRVHLEYPQAGDLNVFLFSPSGTRVKLLERNCGGVSNIDTTFDDNATARFSTACPQAGNGPFQSNEPLALFKLNRALACGACLSRTTATRRMPAH